jgi:uncharacterized protein
MAILKLTPEQHQRNMKEILESVQVIVKKYRPDKVILFGSYAKKEVRPESDVDLFFIIDSEESTWDLAVQISLSMRHSLPMDVIVRTPEEISKRMKSGDFFIRNIMENGMVLYERTGSGMGAKG